MLRLSANEAQERFRAVRADARRACGASPGIGAPAVACRSPRPQSLGGAGPTFEPDVRRHRLDELFAPL